MVLLVLFSTWGAVNQIHHPSTAGVLSDLTYHLTVINMNTGVVIINTTTTTII